MTKRNQVSSFDYQNLYDTLRDEGYQENRDYDSHIRSHISWIKRNISYESVLDIGCGSGGSFRMLGGRYKKEVQGAEVSQTAVEKGLALGRNIVQASATCLPFEDRSFDLVVSSDVFEHLHKDDVPLAASEAIRVAKRFVFMKIATREDVIGRWKRVAGHPLHLTIEPIEWWIEHFSSAGTISWNDQHAFCLQLADQITE